MQQRKRLKKTGVYARPYLVRVFEGDVEVELSEDEELALHHAVPQLPELLVAFEWSAASVEVPG